jgi:hypothetical protein
VRTLALLLVLVVALGFELQHYERGHSRSPARPAPTRQQQAERVLTLLDYWTDRVIPSILLQDARAHALRAGDLPKAAALERRIRTGLRQVRGFRANAARDPLLVGPRTREVRAVMQAGAAWAEWASALLGPEASPDEQPIAHLEANAVRLHQAAYKTVDASIRQLATSSSGGP